MCRERTGILLMLAKTSHNPLPALSSLMGDRPVRFGPPEIGLAVWATVMLVFPILVFRNIDPETLSSHYIEPKAHLLVELFCGFVASLIACLIGAVAMRLRVRSLWLFVGAFLAMGIFDTIHAFTDPVGAREAFVAYHTSSTVAGGVLITLGLMQQVIRAYGLTINSVKWVIVGLLLMFGAAGLYRIMLPGFASNEQFENYRFSTLTHFTHDFVALLYGISSLLLYKLYRETRQVLMLVVGSFLMLFAQSAFLFSFSNMWDFPWWLWHGVKALFYLGMLVSLAVGFLLALDAAQRSHEIIARANTSIQRSRRKIHKANRELHTRNRMLFDAIKALDVPHAIAVVGHAVRKQVQFDSCEFVLLVPEDQVAELARSSHFSGSTYRIRVEAVLITLPVRSRSNKLSPMWFNTPGKASEVCLDLVSHGNRFGYLKFSGVAPNALTASRAELGALASEAGPIIYNALLYLDWQQESAFRAALLRVSTMLTSTLDLGAVLEAVCRESTDLLEADGAVVWLPDQATGGAFSIAAHWSRLSENHDGPCDQVEFWCKGGELCAQLLAEINGLYHPRAWVIGPNGPVQTLDANLGEGKAIALFPLADENKLIGVMLLLRETIIPFSQITLSKGELLAGQVRIAISNASSFSKVAEINQQLLLAETTKIRNERLAALGQMAASVAHEVRNPLSAIANCVSVLKADCLVNGKARTALEIIEDEVSRLDKLTRDFLTFGKPRPVACYPVAVDALFHKICSAFEHYIESERLMIEVKVVVRNIASELMLDADALEMVLWNLLLNAAQAIPERGLIKINLAMRPGYLFLAVTDTGKGIPIEERERIFEPFYSKRSHGAGLGLAIVLRFVQDWGGRIRVMSVPRRGTTFLLMIPVSKPTPVPAISVEQQFNHADITG
ncbi:MAG: histidine kinase [Betaproteobacteria bacterium]|nr:histidine kinase [Betaproteobacteria bacterium]